MLGPPDWLRRHAAKVSPALRRRLVREAGPEPPLGARLVALGRRTEGLPVVLRVHEEALPAGRRAVAEAARRHGGRVRREILRFRSIAASLPPRALAELVPLPEVEYVAEDYRVHALLDVAAPTVGAPVLWDAGLAGAGVAIAIVDSGVFPHPDLVRPKRRILAFHDAVHGRPQPYDDNGHGTHCAGDAAGNGTVSRGRFRGPAPAAEIVAVKALDREGAGQVSTILAGIEWVLAQRVRLNVRVMSLSFGAPAADPPEEDPLVRAVEEAWREGVVVCAAAGNEGPAPGTVGTPGRAPSILTVGASDDRGTCDPQDDRVADFSSRGPAPGGLPKPDLVAPGVAITSLLAPQSRLALAARSDPDGYLTLSGTSMATPILAGVVAQLLGALPRATPDQVKQALLETARSLGAPAEAQGAGLVQAEAALRRLRELVP